MHQIKLVLSSVKLVWLGLTNFDWVFLDFLEISSMSTPIKLSLIAMQTKFPEWEIEIYWWLFNNGDPFSQ